MMYSDEIIKHHLQFASEHTKEMVQQLMDERDALKEDIAYDNCLEENARLREAQSLKDLEEWLLTESYSLGAVDGYDYNSGVEYGLRLAMIEIEKRIKALAPTKE